MTSIKNLYVKYEKPINYVIFATLTTVLNVLTYLLCYNFVVSNILISNIVAYTVSITASFFMNKKYVFKNDSNSYAKQMLFYLIVKLISFGLDSLVLYILKDILNWSNFWAKLISNASTTFSNYFLNNSWVFKNNNK